MQRDYPGYVSAAGGGVVMVEPGRTPPNLVSIGALKRATISLHFDEYNHEAQSSGVLEAMGSSLDRAA